MNYTARTTQAEVTAVFERLCATVGVEALAPKDIYEVSYPNGVRTISRRQGWSLDNAACYGGWTVTANSEGSATGESRPLGEARLPAREFVAAMHFAIRAVECANSLKS